MMYTLNIYIFGNRTSIKEEKKKKNLHGATLPHRVIDLPLLVAVFVPGPCYVSRLSKFM